MLLRMVTVWGVRSGNCVVGVGRRPGLSPDMIDLQVTLAGGLRDIGKLVT